MTWNIARRTQRSSERLTVTWEAAGEVYDAALICGPGVDRTSFGGSSRSVLNASSKPLQGIFRWSEETDQPTVTVRWRDEVDGPIRDLRILLSGE